MSTIALSAKAASNITFVETDGVKLAVLKIHKKTLTGKYKVLLDDDVSILFTTDLKTLKAGDSVVINDSFTIVEHRVLLLEKAAEQSAATPRSQRSTPDGSHRRMF
jgi:hypothetical protein